MDQAEIAALAAPYLEKAKRDAEKGYHLQSALANCDQAIAFLSESASAHNLRGLILDGMGKTGEAVLAYQEAVRIDPGCADAQSNLESAEAEVRLKLQQSGPAKTQTILGPNIAVPYRYLQKAKSKRQ